MTTASFTSDYRESLTFYYFSSSDKNHSTISYTDCDTMLGGYGLKMYGEFRPNYTYFEDVHLTGCRQLDGYNYTYVGGFVAYTFGVSIVACSNNIDYTEYNHFMANDDGMYVGGFVGVAMGTVNIIGCDFTGSYTADVWNIIFAGFLFENQGTALLKNCTSGGTSTVSVTVAFVYTGSGTCTRPGSSITNGFAAGVC